MASVILKWLAMLALVGANTSLHPFFVSVTEIEHNATNKTLEISCKIFTDDFETALRNQYNTKIDLSNAQFKTAMSPLVNGYLQKHLSIIVGGSQVNLRFLGFEHEEEGIISYFEAKDVSKVEKIEVVNNILYEIKKEQIEIIHVIVNGGRKSSRLNNPDERVSFQF